MGLAERDYMRERARGRIRAATTRRNAHARWRWTVPGLVVLFYVTHFVFDAKRNGWFPDLETPQVFPETGSVTVREDAIRTDRFAPLTVVASNDDAVVQLLDSASDPAFTLFVRHETTGVTRAPQGLWRLRIIEGRKWHGPVKFFGPNTNAERAIATFELQREGKLIDLRRSPSGNLHTRPELSSPKL